MSLWKSITALFSSKEDLRQSQPPQAQVKAPIRNDGDTWVMPKYQNKDICDWCDEISQLKKEKRYSEALAIAQGCMEAMGSEARKNPNNVMEFYVRQVVIIQRKMKDYAGEISTLESWLKLELPAPREDYRVDLLKRLAKANELLAKAEGRDASEYTAQWRRMVEREKVLKEKPAESTVSSGRSKNQPTAPSYRRYHRAVSHGVAPSEILSQTSFVAVDFETANSLSGVSACQIALVKVHSGQVVDRLVTFLRPPAGFDHFEFTYLHGISKKTVRRAPTWDQISQQVHYFVDGLPTYAHNASFDAKVWRELDEHYNLQTCPASFYCSYRTAQRLVPGLSNYKLPTVTQALVPNFRLNHHKADSDAEACARIIIALQAL